MLNKIATALILLLFCYLNNVRSQLSDLNVGVPLPSFKSGQGQSVILKNDKIPTKLNFKSSHPNSVTSRGLGGSLQYIANPTTDKYIQNLVKHPVLLHGIQKKTRADQAVRVESIITAHKQVVSGQIIYLTLRVVEVDCPIGTPNVASCHKDASEDPYICEMAVWERPWLNSTKIVEEKSRCEEFEDDVVFKNWWKGSDDAYENGFLEYPMITSLPSPIDEEQISLEAFNFVDRASQSNFKGKMMKYTISSVKYNPARNISKIKVKVEYGLTLCIKLPSLKVDTRACPLDGTRNTFICSVDVASNPRSPTSYEIIPDDDDNLDCEEKQPVEELLVVPVKAPCTGCPQTISLNDPKVQELADFAIVEYDQKNDDSELHRAKKIIKAHYQVESKIKYLLTVEVVETDCKKSMNAINMNRSFCNDDPFDTAEICDFLILDQPWQKTKELVDVDCSDKNDHRRDEFIIPVVGGSTRSSLQLSAPHRSSSSHTASLRSQKSSVTLSNGLQESVDFVLKYINHLDDSDEDFDGEDDDGLMVLQKVHKSESQLGPAGEEMHHLIIELGETICKKKRPSANCPLKHGEENEVCEALILVGSRKRISYLDCEDLDHYMKKTLTPYQHVQQPFFALAPQTTSGRSPSSSPAAKSFSDDPVAQEVASSILHQYNLQNDDDELFKLGHITTFVPQGTGYLVELELLETECKKYQPITDVSKCPIDVGEDPQFCQAQVDDRKAVTRLYCDDRDDFFVKKTTRADPSALSGEWKPEDTTSQKIKSMGELVADEFDIRSDKDNIFVLHRVLEANSLSVGLKHFLKVELSETVCPKYKARINKTRCMVDVGEDLKICHAFVVDHPWNNGQEVTDLSCSEKDRSHEDRSIEVHYASVHPSAHVRPKFIKSVFFSKKLGSIESDESNEKYYQGGVLIHRSSEKDSDEVFLRSFHASDVRRSTHEDRFRDSFGQDDHDDDDGRDSDNDKDSRSHEFLLGRSRFRRSAPEEIPKSRKVAEASLFEGTEAVHLDQGVWDLAIRALYAMDSLTHEKVARRVQDVLQASKKNYSSGSQWMLTLRVTDTICLMKKVTSPKKLLNCKTEPNSLNYLCSFTFFEANGDSSLQMKKSKCYPDMA